MELKTVVPENGKKIDDKEEKNKHDVEPIVEEAFRILEENSRKVEKTRELLHTADKIDVGILSHEIVEETRLCRDFYITVRWLVGQQGRRSLLCMH